MGSTVRHLVDNPPSSADPLTLGTLIFVLLVLFLTNRQSTSRFVLALTCCLMLADMPYDQSLMKRSGVLKPLFQAALGRDEL